MRQRAPIWHKHGAYWDFCIVFYAGLNRSRASIRIYKCRRYFIPCFGRSLSNFLSRLFYIISWIIIRDKLCILNYGERFVQWLCKWAQWKFCHKGHWNWAQLCGTQRWSWNKGFICTFPVQRATFELHLPVAKKLLLTIMFWQQICFTQFYGITKVYSEEG